MGPLRLSFLAVSRYSRNLLQRSMSISSKVHLPCTKFAELLAVIPQEIGFEFVLVEEIIPFIHDRLESAATDGFGFLGHYLVEIQLAFVSRIGIDINTK